MSIYDVSIFLVAVCLLAIGQACMIIYLRGLLRQANNRADIANARAAGFAEACRKYQQVNVDLSARLRVYELEHGSDRELPY